MTDAAIPPRGRGSRIGESEWSVIWRALQVQARALAALFLRESLTRRSRALPLGLTAWVEPFVAVAEITLFFSLIERHPPYGESLLLFVGTGVFPVYMFAHTVRTMRGPMSSSWFGRLPIETPLDIGTVHAVLQFIGSATVAFVYFLGLYLLGVKAAAPANLWAAIDALLAIFSLGVAVGVFNAMLARFFPLWDTLWPPIARASLHFSGMYYVADYLTPNIRQYFALNPLIHAVNWFRHAFYPFYPSVLDNHVYPLAAAAVTMLLSLCMERVMNKRIFETGDL
jgi:capsular polysaccharide transport system permease protein